MIEMKPFNPTKQFFAFVALGLAVVDASLAGPVIHGGCANDDGECADIAKTPTHPFQPLPGTVRIPRESRLSLRDFFERYADLQKPVIVTDYAFAFENLTAKNINRVCGREEVLVTRRNQDPDEKWAGIEKKESGRTLSEVLEDPSQGEDNRTLGLFDWSLPWNCPKLMKENFKIPKYFAQDYLQRIPPTEIKNYREYWPSLFVGAAGSYAAPHRDAFGSAFWQYVVEGEKEWNIVDYVDKSQDLFSMNSTKPHGMTHYHDVLQPGDLLIVQGNAWHQVRNGPNSRTVTICGNFISRGSISSMKNEMKPYIDKGENPNDYRHLWDVFFKNPFNETIDMDGGDMDWDEYKTQYEEAFPLVVVVSGAGTPEVNGHYYFTEMWEGAGQFEKKNEDGSAFEIFRVEETNWWNILKRAPDGSYPYDVTYGALRDTENLTPGKTSEFFPPKLGWGSQNIKANWLGTKPYPKMIVLRSFDENEQEKGEVGSA